jgi:hypothetical protein
MVNLRRAVLLVLAFPILALAVDARPASSVNNELLDGRKIVNLVDDFLDFWDQAKNREPRSVRRLWKRLVEDKHKDYFERAVYRGATIQERRAIREAFLLRIGGRIEVLRDFNNRAADRVIDSLVAFKWRFPDYRQAQDVYVGLSLFTFDGSIRAVNNEFGVPDTLCLGAEVLAGYSDEELRIAITHEFFHLYHFNHLFQQPELEGFATAHVPLIVEGLAVVATEAVYPKRPLESYLHFTSYELGYQRELLGDSSTRYLEMMLNGSPPSDYEGWFRHSTDPTIPPRAGYLLGYEVAKRLLALHSFEEIMQMSTVQLREHAEEQLAAIAIEQMMMSSRKMQVLF